jgi:integrase
LSRTKLTAQTVADARPEQVERVEWDASLPGFGLRIQPTGRKTFIVKYRVGKGRGARQGKMSLGEPGRPLTVSEARTEAARILAAAKLGNDPAEGRRVTEAEARTVNAMLDEWEREGAPFDRRNGRRRKAASVAGDIRRLNAHVRPTIGTKRLSDVTPDVLRRLRTDIATGKTAGSCKARPRGKSKFTGGDGTAVATLRILKSALGYAVEKGWIDANPAKLVRLPATNERERFLSPTEIRRLGSALAAAETNGTHPYALAIIRLLALTGARRGEIEGLKWEQLDLERGFALLRDTKTGKAFWPLSRAAVEILDSIAKTHSPYVFPASRYGAGHYRGLNKVWPEIRSAAGLDDVRLHDLRHSFASVGAANGVGLPIIGKLLGHRQASTTARYAHLADDPLRAAADLMAGEIAQNLKGGGEGGR